LQPTACRKLILPFIFLLFVEQSYCSNFVHIFLFLFKSIRLFKTTAT
jgi:hypothetical protein